MTEYSQFAHASVQSHGLELGALRKSGEHSHTIHSNGGAYAKRIFDFASSVCALMFLLPMFIMLTVILFILQGRPIFIKHNRVGRAGRMFGCLKFRTMVVDAQAVLEAHLSNSESSRNEWALNQKLKNDPRITPLGKILRKSSLDELPQLLNIMRGDMSVVGPRPIVEDEVRHYGKHIADYAKVRPGLTGLWQVSGRSDISYKSRVSMDVAYVENWSFSKDMVIIAKTIPAVLNSAGSY